MSRSQQSHSKRFSDWQHGYRFCMHQQNMWKPFHFQALFHAEEKSQKASSSRAPDVLAVADFNHFLCECITVSSQAWNDSSRESEWCTRKKRKRHCETLFEFASCHKIQSCTWLILETVQSEQETSKGCCFSDLKQVVPNERHCQTFNLIDKKSGWFHSTMECRKELLDFRFAFWTAHQFLVIVPDSQTARKQEKPHEWKHPSLLNETLVLQCEMAEVTVIMCSEIAVFRVEFNDGHHSPPYKARQLPTENDWSRGKEFFFARFYSCARVLNYSMETNALTRIVQAP